MLLTKNAPTVIGSLTNLTVVDGAEGFSVGNIVSVTSTSGRQAQARVASILTQSGLVDFTLLNGGWGYTTNSIVYISTSVLGVTGIIRSLGTFESQNPAIFDVLYQPLANIQYAYANGSFNLEDTLTVYNGSGAILGNGTILSISSVNSTAGYLLVSVLSGNLQGNTVYYNNANAVTANSVAYTNVTANGTLIQIPSVCNVHYNAANGIFMKGDTLYQRDTSNAIVATGYIANVDTLNTTLSLSNCSALFYTGINAISQANGTVGNITSLDVSYGIISTSNFTSLTGNWVYISDMITQGNVVSISTGVGATFQIASLNNIETVNLNTDFLSTYANVTLGTPNYGVSLNHSNANTTLAVALNYAAVNLGSITMLTGINPGANYSFAPSVLIYEPLVAPYNQTDYIFTISSPSGLFTVGEKITQSNTGAIGLVLSSNSTTIHVQRIQFEADWVANNWPDTSWLITGQSSNTTANLVSISNAHSIIGENANVIANTTIANGSVGSLSIVDSGFCFNQGDVATFTSEDGTISGTAIAALNQQGASRGYYLDRKGFLDADQIVTDSFYWQQFSYDIQAPIPLPEFEFMLKKLLHTAGKIYFNSVIRQSNVGGNTGINQAIITITSSNNVIDYIFETNAHSEYLPLIT